MATVGVTLEFKFTVSEKGDVRASRHYGYPFWRRYLTAFDEVKVFGRFLPIDYLESTSGDAVEGPGVEFIPLAPAARSAPRFSRAALAHLASCDLVVGRVPGLTSQRLLHHARSRGQPIAVEVVGDPRESVPAALGASGVPFGWALARSMRSLISDSIGASFVTQRVLQERYPPPEGRPTAFYSSVEISADWFSTAPEASRLSEGGRILRIITVASLERPYKGVDDLIRAVAELDRLHHQGNQRIQLIVVGGGQLRDTYQIMAQRHDIDAVFTGHIPRGAVRELMRTSDVFALASRTEGLPRALLEAMACGLPCVATRVGGVPELLAADATAERGDVLGLLKCIDRFMRSPEDRAREGARNRNTARSYDASSLARARTSFYTQVASATGSYP